MSKFKKTRALFKVGDWALLQWPSTTVSVRIIEDRGQLGVRGRRLYRIELPRDDLEPDRFEVAEEDLSAAAAAPNTTGNGTP